MPSRPLSLGTLDPATPIAPSGASVSEARTKSMASSTPKPTVALQSASRLAQLVNLTRADHIERRNGVILVKAPCPRMGPLLRLAFRLVSDAFAAVALPPAQC